MEQFQKILALEFLQNTVRDYLVCALTLLIGLLIIKILQDIIFTRLKKIVDRTDTQLDDRFVQIVDGAVVPFLYLGIIYTSIQGLVLHPNLTQGINVVGTVILTILGVRFLVSIIEYGLNIYWMTQHAEATRQETINMLMPAIRAVVWGIGLVFMLDNLGFDISAVIAGLGIGGAAVALASRGVLEDLFSYFSILFDRPFEIGDFLIVGDYMGTVENIGIKTTRLRSLSGEQLIFSNTDLTSSRVQNYKRMSQRRAAFNIAVTYETGLQHLSEIPAIVRHLIEGIEGTSFDRAHFATYGDFSLNFEVVYYVIGSDYAKYMDIQQQINLSLKEEFDQRGIEFAYPTQKLYLNQAPATAHE
jgi:small-conductance mechanosensitive channel